MMAVLLLVLVFVGVPVFAVVAVAALNAYWQAELEPGLVVLEFMNLAVETQLLALPIFCLTGLLLGHRFLRDLIGVAEAVLGRARSGFDPIAWMALLLLVGYAVASVALLAGIPALLYSVMVAQVAPRQAVAVETMVVAAALPLLLIGMLFLLSVVLLWPGRAVRRVSRSELCHAAGKVFWQLPLPPILFVAIAVGWLTLFEAALVGLLWVMLTSFVSSQRLEWQRSGQMMVEATVSSASILLLVGLSMVWAGILNDTAVPQAVLERIGPLAGHPSVLLVLLLVASVAGGWLLGLHAGLVFLAPLAVPVGLAGGIDPVHLGIVFVAAVLVGSRLQAAAKLEWGSGGAGDVLLWPALAGLLLIAGLPGVSLWLPSLASV